MRGYKSLIYPLTNRYGFSYEIGKQYKLDGELKWSKNGFHFCLRPEDTLRYVDGYNDSIVFALVEGSGDIILYEDEYYGFYDMYASSEMTILKTVSRESVFKDIIDSHNPDRVKRYSSLIKLEDYEIDEILKKYPEVKSTIDYYQNKEYVLKRKLEL